MRILVLVLLFGLVCGQAYSKEPDFVLNCPHDPVPLEIEDISNVPVTVLTYIAAGLILAATNMPVEKRSAVCNNLKHTIEFELLLWRRHHGQKK